MVTIPEVIRKDRVLYGETLEIVQRCTGGGVKHKNAPFLVRGFVHSHPVNASLPYNKLFAVRLKAYHKNQVGKRKIKHANWYQMIFTGSI